MTENAKGLDIDQLWDRNSPAISEARFREASQSAGSIAPSHHLELLTQLARSIGLQNRFEEAHALLDQVEQQMSDEMMQVRVRYLLERGRVFNSSGKPATACPLFHQALMLAKESNLDFHAVDAAHMLGIAEDTPEKQMDWNEKALSIAESSTDPKAKKWAGSLYNNMGWTRFEQKEYSKALALFLQGILFRERMNQPRELRIAKYAAAKTMRVMGRIDEAHYLIKAVWDEAASINEVHNYFDEELAECLLAMGNQPKHSRSLPELMQCSPRTSGC